jgi:hypothetical protein
MYLLSKSPISTQTQFVAQALPETFAHLAPLLVYRFLSVLLATSISIPSLQALIGASKSFVV